MTLPKIGEPAKSRLSFETVRVLESFGFPILTEMKDEQGRSWLRLAMTGDKTQFRDVVFHTTPELISMYLRGCITLLHLVLQNEQVYLHDKGLKSESWSLARIKDLPANHLPKKFAYHDPDLDF